MKFARGLNRPVVVFLTPHLDPYRKARAAVPFDVQCFAPNGEFELCGHGTITAIGVVLDSVTDSPGFGQGNRFPVFSFPRTRIVELTTTGGIVICSRSVAAPDEVSGKEEDWFEIILPAGKLRKLPAEEEEIVFGLINRAVGKEPKVKSIGTGEPPLDDNLLLVLDESKNLERLNVDASALVSS